LLCGELSRITAGARGSHEAGGCGNAIEEAREPAAMGIVPYDKCKEDDDGYEDGNLYYIRYEAWERV
jgi:hypothetical protein